MTLTSDSEMSEIQFKPNNLPYTKKFDDQIYYVQFSPFEWSSDILCVVFAKKICVAQVKFQEEFSFEIAGEFNHEVQCSCITLSPQTSLSVIPKILQFTTAGDDFKIRYFKSDLLNNNTCQVVNGHTNYINDLSFDPENNFLASVSDDQTARIWDTLNDCAYIAVFYLTSPGISVCWHNEDTAKLMVAEKNGLIRFYSMQSQQPILSLEHSSSISFAHWCPSDPQIIGVMQKGEIFLWDLTRPSRPAHVKVVHVDGGGHFQFSSFKNLLASVNTLQLNLKVIQLENGQVKLDTKVMLPTNVSWHFTQPLLCIADDRNLCFYKINPN